MIASANIQGNISAMHKKLTTTLLAVVLFLSYPAEAGTDELEALMHKSLNEAKAAGRKYENNSCGHIFVAQGEYVEKDPGDRPRNYPVNWTPESSWGCNSSSLSSVQSTSKFEHRHEETKGQTSVQYVASAHGIYHLDPGPSTEIAGAVIDKNSNPVKDAEVRAENVNKNQPPVTSRTDASGKYVLKVGSGQYRVTAKTAACRAEQTIWACSYGKILEPRRHVPRFPLDLIADCGDMDLNIVGTYTSSIRARLEGVAVDMDSKAGEMKGKVPLTLDEKTGKITGEGTLMLSATTDSGGGVIMGTSVSASGTNSAMELQLAVEGNLDSGTGIASLTCSCKQTGALTQTAVVRAGSGGGSAAVTDSAQACSGKDWQLKFDVPWKTGESHHVDREIRNKIEGIALTHHEVMDLTLGDRKEDDGGDDKQGSSVTGGGSSPPSVSGGSPGKAGGDGNPLTPLAMPECVEGEEDSDGCVPPELMKQMKDMQHLQGMPPELKQLMERNQEEE